MYQKVILFMSLLTCLTITAGQNHSASKKRIITPVLPALPESLTKDTVLDFITPKESYPDEPFRVFLNLLALTNDENCAHYLEDVAVCFDYDGLLFYSGREGYTKRSDFLDVVINQLNKCQVPLSICSRQAQVDEKQRDRLAIAQDTFSNSFKGYRSVWADRTVSKENIALDSRLSRTYVVLIDDSKQELDKIENAFIGKIEVPVPKYSTPPDSSDPEVALAKAQSSYLEQEQALLEQVRNELN